MEYKRRRVLLGCITLAVLVGMFILPGTELSSNYSGFGDVSASELGDPHIYPLRPVAAVILAVGLLFYLFWRRPGKDKAVDIAYPAWRMACGDLVSITLFAFLFSLPFLMAGGTIQAFTSQGRIMFIVIWAFAVAAIALLQMIARMASLRITVVKDGLEYATASGKRDIPFDTIDFAFPMQYKTSSALVAGSGLATALRGGQGLGGAILLAFSESQGLGIHLKNGDDIHLWLTDQMGNRALKNAPLLFEALDKAGIPFQDEVRKFQGLAMPSGKGPAAKPPRLVPTLLIVLPYLLLIGMEAIAAIP